MLISAAVSNTKMRNWLMYICTSLLLLSISSNVFAADQNNPLNQLRVAYFSQDPPAIVSTAPSFDPDSYSVITQIFDSLVHFDLDGNIQPALALNWQQQSDTRWLFNLRRNVHFHNGEPFNAKAVKFTYDYILDPQNNAGNHWILSAIKQVVLLKDNPYQVIIETHRPDNMLLNRLSMFGAICPPQYIKQKGMAYFSKHPIGTGPFRFEQWQHGKAIELSKNPNYWQPGIPHYNKLSFNMLDQAKWLEAIISNQVDLVPNFPGNRTTELMQRAGNNINLIKRLVLAGYWVLMHNEGILADVNVRKAMNFAVNRQDLVRFGDYGNAIPLASLGKKHEFGANSALQPYRYDPEYAKILLAQANVQPGHKLTMLSAKIAEPIAKIIISNLKDIGFEVSLDVVSRSEWANRVISHKIVTGQRSGYDLVVNLVDNPIYHLGFHAGLFLDSRSPWAQFNDPEFNRRLDLAMTQTQPDKVEQSLMALDKYIYDNAMMLFTTQRIMTVVASKNTSVKQFGLSGHLDYKLLSDAQQVSHD